MGWFWKSRWVAGLAFLALAAQAGAQEVNTRVRKEGRVEQPLISMGQSVMMDVEALSDIYALGGEVYLKGTAAADVRALAGRITVEAPVRGNLTLAAGRIVVLEPVGGNILALGGEVDLEKPVEGNILGVGGDFHIKKDVKGNVTLFSGEVHVDQGVVVWGNLYVRGGRVVIDGEVDGHLDVEAGEVRLNGKVGGKSRLKADQIVLGPKAVVNGDLTVKSHLRADIHHEAAMEGNVIYQPEEAPSNPWVGIVITGLLLISGLAGLAVLLAGSMPAYCRKVAATIQAAPLRAIGLGMAFAVVTPVAVVLLFVTVIGIPIALAAILAYLLMLNLGFLAFVYYQAEAVAQKFTGGEPSMSALAGWMFITLAFLALIFMVPVLGFLLFFTALFAGTGSLLENGYLLWKGEVGHWGEG